MISEHDRQIIDKARKSHFEVIWQLELEEQCESDEAANEVHRIAMRDYYRQDN